MPPLCIDVTIPICCCFAVNCFFSRKQNLPGVLTETYGVVNMMQACVLKMKYGLGFYCFLAVVMH